MQCIPDFQQNTLGILPPLMVPKAKFLNAVRVEPPRSFAVMQLPLRRTVLKAVELNGQLGEDAEKVQKVFSRRMLAAEFESRKPSGPQRSPELLLLGGLPTAEAAGVVLGVHQRRLKLSARGIKAAPLPNPLPIRSSWGEGIEAPATDYICGELVSL